MLPGVSRVQEAELKKRGYRSRADLSKVLRRAGPNHPTISALPPAARAELVHRPKALISLTDATDLAEKLKKCLVLDTPTGRRLALHHRVITVGSARREKKTMKDLDLLVVLPDSFEENQADLAYMKIKPQCSRSVAILESYASGPRRRSFVVRAKNQKANYRVDLFLAYEKERPYALLHYTGSRAYNIRIRAYAKRKGWKLNQYGLFYQPDSGASRSAKERRVPGSSRIRTEEGLARFLGITVRAPKDRYR